MKRLRLALFIALLAWIALPAVGRADTPAPPIPPGYNQYCPRPLQQGDQVRLRVAVAASGPGSTVEFTVPAGLMIERAPVAVSDPAATRFQPVVGFSAEAGQASVFTGPDDRWSYYTAILDVRARAGFVGEQVAVATVRDASGTVMRKVDAVLYVAAAVPDTAAGRIEVDMGVPNLCVTPVATATPSATPTPLPPYARRVEGEARIDGVAYRIMTLCVFDPAGSGAAGQDYRAQLVAPEAGRVAAGVGPNPLLATDGRTASFSTRAAGPGQVLRVAVALRAAVPGTTLDSNLPVSITLAAGERSVSPPTGGDSAGCVADVALLGALEAAARQRAAMLTGQPSAPDPADLPPDLPPTATPTPTPMPTPTPTATPTLTSREYAATIAPDGRALLLPCLAAFGIALLALSATLVNRRRETASQEP
ncbi:MAG: hypothetical protein K1X39_00360 [Thermoflexales bacterium]|nr:hypothetical protein [Thermoflexales bacterium]